MSKGPLSRRTWLRGAGGALLALPFLEAMLPKLVFAGPTAPYRFVTAFCGTVVGVDASSSPGGYGALPATLPPSWKGLEAVRSHVSVVSNLNIPVYNNGQTPPGPASAYNMQHGTTPAPMLAGVTSREAMPVMVNGQTADQYAADALGAGSKVASLQVRTQLFPYTGSNNNNKGIMSARRNGTALNALPPIASPAQLYTLLFGGGSTPPPVGGPDPRLRRASVLDLVADDAAQLRRDLAPTDRARLEQHFEEVRAIEVALRASVTGGGGGGGGGTCTNPMAAPTDPPAGTNTFIGWSNETLRGELMADMIAYALACDLTRVASWMLTFDQVQMANALDRTTEMHDDSHNGGTRAAAIAANANWHATLFGRLVGKLAALPDGGATVLDTTFLSLMFAESKTAHGRSGMRHIVAGIPSKIRAGQHIDGAGQHPGKIQIAGLQAIGASTNTLGELTGALGPIQV